jgi:hypothetical protein
MRIVVFAALICLLAPFSSFGQSCGCIAAHPVEIAVNVHNPPQLNYDKAVAANMQWVRSAIRWEEVEPVQGQWTWDFTDEKVRLAKQRGLKLLMILHGVPRWANGGRANNVPAWNRALWTEYVRQVAQRYNGSLGWDLKVDAYQIWNEPDVVDGGDGVGWNQNENFSPKYADYVHDAALQIRASSDSLVVAGAYSSREEYKYRMATMASQIESSVYPEGPLSNFIDVLSFHANGVNFEHSDNPTDRAKFRISEHANKNPSTACKPKWITEFGYATSSVSESSQLDRIRRMVEMFAGSINSSNCTGWQRGTHNVELAFIYINMDEGSPSRGIHRTDGSPKPVVTNYLRLLPYPASDM